VVFKIIGAVEGIQIPARNPKGTHVFHQYTIRVMRYELGGMSEENIKTHNSYLIPHNSKRDAVRKLLSEQGIPTMVYYPIELHKQKAFEKYWDGAERFPVSEELVQTVLSLPMHTEMTREMVEYVCSNLLSIVS
jgi:dTDP-4-amino-4,6-dideoxygalactose transaminase